MELITTTEELAATCERLAAHPFVTIDTEFLRETTYYPLLCVAQVAFLILALVPVLPIWGARLSCMTGLTLLIYSFAVDIVWLYARARSDGTLRINSA